MQPLPRRPHRRHHRHSTNRRQFLHSALLLAAGAPAIAVLLDACSTGGEEDTALDLRVAAPDNPVTWDITPDNTPTAGGLRPEKNATLRIYTYPDYIGPTAIATFEDTYGVRVGVSTFNSTDSAIDKLSSGTADIDIYTPSYDQIGRLIAGGLLRPLNHGYVPNIANVWPNFTDPWYDGEWRYSVPYTVYTTGIGWRTDQIPADIAALPNPYDALWDSAYRNKTAVIDDGHTVISMVLLKLGITDVNTSSAEDLDGVRESLAEMWRETSPAVTATMYTDLPAGLMGVSQIWSDDVISAKDYLPEGVSPDILRYWFPADGKGLVDNDLLVTLRSGRNPVAAQLFLNHMLDPQIAKANFAEVGCQSPQKSMDADSLIASRLIPATLRSAIVRPEFLDTGYRILELNPANAAAWEDIWRDFKNQRS